MFTANLKQLEALPSTHNLAYFAVYLVVIRRVDSSARAFSQLACRSAAARKPLAAAPAPAAGLPHIRLHGEAASQGASQQLGARTLPAAACRAAAARRVTP